MYFRPSTLNEAVDVLAAQGGQILSGGTDFFPALGDRPAPDRVVDISGLAEIRGITLTPDFVRIGGLTTWSDVVAAPLPRCFDALKTAAREIGGIQIQNRGTIAGNLCNASPAADGVPPLLALDAEIELVSAAGTRRVALADFIVGNRKTLRRPDEILATVIVPRGLDDAVLCIPQARRAALPGNFNRHGGRLNKDRQRGPRGPGTRRGRVMFGDRTKARPSGTSTGRCTCGTRTGRGRCNPTPRASFHPLMTCALPQLIAVMLP